MKPFAEFVSDQFDSGTGTVNLTEHLYKSIQADALAAGERKGMERAVEIVLEYSKAMCGAHVNTNDSCGTIRRAILNAAKEVK